MRGISLALVLLTTLHPFTAGDGEIAASGAYQSGHPLLYIATLSGEVTAYDPGSSGLVSPVRRLRGPITGLKDSWAVAFDTTGDLYVQNFLGNSTTDVFAPDVNGDTAPLRVSKNEATTRDACSLAVDSKGNVYVPRLTPVSTLDVFPPNSSGPTLPSRTLQLDGEPTSVTLDADGNLIVGVLNTPTGNAIEIFGPTAEGSAQPLRRISGVATALGNGSFYNGGFLVVNYSPFTNLIYAAVSGDFNPAVSVHISVFPVHGNGDIKPVRTISGPNTLLGETITGLASDPETGEILALSVTSKLATPHDDSCLRRLRPR